MARPSKIQRLPKAVREELDKKLIENCFSDYSGLSQWLNEKGYEICRGSVFYYGASFKKKFDQLQELTEQVRAVARAGGDTENVLGDAANLLALQKAFEAISELDSEDLKEDPYKLMSAIASLNRSRIAVQKYQAEVKERAEAAAKEVSELIKDKEKGLSDDTAALIRAKILGIAS